MALAAGPVNRRFPREANHVRFPCPESEIRNHKSESVEVITVEHLHGDWTILRSSHEYRQKDAGTVEFPVQVAPDEEKVITYTVRLQW